VELLLQKLRRLEEKRRRDSVSHLSSESASPQKEQGSNSNILEQVIKRLERLKSRDSSV